MTVPDVAATQTRSVSEALPCLRFVLVAQRWLKSAKQQAESAPRLQCLFRRANTVIKRFFKKRNAAQVRMGEVHALVWPHRRRPCAAPDKAGPRPDHRMAPAHYVQAIDQGIDVRMGPP